MQPRTYELWPIREVKVSDDTKYTTDFFFFLFLFSFFFLVETEGRHTSAKAQEAIDHPTSFCQVQRRFHNRESNNQLFSWDLSIFPPSSSSLGSSRTLSYTNDLGEISHMRLRARYHCTSSTPIGGKGRAGGPISLLYTTLEETTEWVCECKMDVKSTLIPTWHRMDHVSWSLELISKNYLLEIDLTQDHETKTLRMLITVGLFYFIMCGNPRE